MGLILEVVYASPGGLRHDYDTQLKVGGLFARLRVPAGLPPLAALDVVLRVADDAELRLPARLTVATGDSLCVELAADARGDAALWVEQVCDGWTADPAAARIVRLLSDAAAPQPQPEPEAQPEPPETPARAAARAAASAALPIARRIDLMSVAEKVHLAQHGERDARGILSRDRAGVVQCALVRNPRMGADEIVTLARNPQLAADCAEALAQHPTHGRSSEVAFALCRNPRTPIPIVTQLIGRLGQNELRSLAKGLGVRTQVAMAARKRLFNP